MTGSPGRTGKDRIIFCGGCLLAVLLSSCVWLAVVPAMIEPAMTAGQDSPAASGNGMRLVEHHSATDGFLTHCTGRVKNETDHTVTEATIVFKVMDSERAVAGTAVDHLTVPLAPGEQWAYDAVCFRSPAGGYTDLMGIDHN